MLLAGDVGATKIFIGLFARDLARPQLLAGRAYRTLEFDNLGALSRQFLADEGADASQIEAACFGVAGPVTGTRARLTNVPWIVDVAQLRDELPVPSASLLNDLEALAWSIPVLQDDEIATLRAGRPSSTGNAALIAAGTGLGVALLPYIGSRFAPVASEGGHVDYAGRNDAEIALQQALIREYGRAELEQVVSGPGLANIFRLVHQHQCHRLSPLPAPDLLPAAITRAALEDRCPRCIQTLELFVSAYGAAAGNLALTALATAGVFVGGGIAPRILEALRWPMFLDAFSAKPPMHALMAHIPVKVILNPKAGLIGAATYAMLS